MGYISLAFVLLLGTPSLVTGASKPLPSVYIQMDFKFTWPEFCLLETYFKTKMAELVIQDNGTPIMFSQVYLNNFDENCPAPKNSTKEVSLLFYVVKPNGGYQDVDVNLTIGAYKVLHYLVENKLGRMLGPLFELKIKKVEAKGEDAPPKPTGFTELERTYIAIGIAVGILAIIILFIVAVYFIKKRTRPTRRHQATHTTGEENKGIEIIESPPLNANKEQHVYEEPESPSSPAETKF